MSAVAIYQVDGITCLDCAQKFEQAVSALPGVTKATLNSMTGKLRVEGEQDLESIRRLGREEDYVISPVEEARSAGGEPPAETGWERRRAVASGVCLVAAYGVETFGGPGWAFMTLYVVTMAMGGWGNFRKAAHSLPAMNFNMSVLMSMAVIGALAIGQYEEGATVAFLYAISEMLEAWTMDKARRSIRQLMDIAPRTARVLRSGMDADVPVERVEIGDILIIRPGEKIAMDGVIMQGESAVNQAAITGEPIPAEKRPGDAVYAGTLNCHGSLEVRVTKRVEDTTLARIIHMVEEAQAKRAPAQAFVDRFAAVYTPVVLALAIGIVFIPPLLLGFEWIPWIYRGLALLVVSCPCALVVSTPVAVVSAISTAARHGVLIKGGLHLETMGTINSVAFDKTGTLTKGDPVVTDIVPFGSLQQSRLLEMAADLEVRSGHPLAVAIVNAARERGYIAAPAADFASIAGKGAKGTIDGQMVYIGNLRLWEEMGTSLELVEESAGRLIGQGRTVMALGTLNGILGLIAIADELRAESAAAVSELKAAGISHTILLTGDNEAAAKAMATAAGVDEYRAELLPQDKVDAVRELLAKYGKVAMVGDGINDAPALAAATVGIAMGGAASDTALETADIALLADDLGKLAFAVRLSRRSLSIIRQNIGFSLCIKVLAVLAVFPGWLTLWLAILADMGATLLVTLNSLRLLRINGESEER